MENLQLFKDLKLTCYSYDEDKKLLSKISDFSQENSYELSSETIKIFRYLEENKINFLENDEGNIKIVS